MKKKEILKKMLVLIEDFVEGRIEGKEYEIKYMKLWEYLRDNTDGFRAEVQDILDVLYSDTDCFQSDPNFLEELRKEDFERGEESRFIDENQLRALAKEKLEKLRKILQNKHNANDQR